MAEWVIGIGAQKCATTWTYEVLRAHPDIAMSHVKELHFFSHQYNKGAEWYRAQFGSQTHKARGEFSTSYLYDESVPRRIDETLGRPRLVLNVRNPVDRLISHYKHLVRDGVIEEKMPLHNAILSFPALVNNGLYGVHLERFLATFPRESILVISAEYAASDPESVVRRLYEHAGLPEFSFPEVARTRVSAGIVPRNQQLESARRSIYRMMKRSRVARLISIARRSGLSNLYRRLNSSPKEALTDHISRYERLELWERFSESVHKLEESMGQRFPEIYE